MYVSRDQKDWDTHLPAILFGFRVSPHETTGDSPFYLLYGREPRLPVDVSLLPPSNVTNSIKEHRARIVQTIEEAHAIARANTQRTQQSMKARYDRSAREPKFMLGDRVWVYTPKTKKGLSRKLMHHWHGPYRIIEKCSPVHFKLRTCDNRLVSITVHANRMKPYHDPESRPHVPPSIEMPDEPPIPEDELPDDALVDNTPVNEPSIDEPTPPDPSVVEDDSATYNIESIIRERKRKGKKQFLVKWEGYGPEHNSWVDETDMIHLQQNND
jgi:hypothetical protein